METIIDLLPRVANVMRYHLEDTNEVMTEKNAWLELVELWKKNQAEALIDDMQEYVDMYSNRIALVTEHLKSFK